METQNIGFNGNAKIYNDLKIDNVVNETATWECQRDPIFIFTKPNTSAHTTNFRASIGHEWVS